MLKQAYIEPAKERRTEGKKKTWKELKGRYRLATGQREVKKGIKEERKEKEM